MRSYIKRIGGALVGLSLLTALGFMIQPTAAQTTSIPAATASPTPDAISTQVAALLAKMTLEQKVGQLFLVSAEGTGLSDQTAQFLAKAMPGGVVLFDSNGTTPGQVTATVNVWQSKAISIGANLPLLVATDQEGGPVTRLADGFSTFPAGPALAAMPPSDAQIVGQVVGAELSAVGINMDLAPVTDVQTIPDNPIMNGRSMGADPDRVGHAAAAFNAGLLHSGVIGVLKHFPGHGDASDSHSALPSVKDPRARVESVELQSFRLAIQAGAESVMIGHLVYPALDPVAGRAASVSPVVIGDILRGELGFQGVVMTDALDMGAITQDYSSGTAATLAIAAGADMVTTGPHLTLDQEQVMVNSVIAAVKKGSISQARIDEAVTRVLMLKARHGLLTWQPLDVQSASQRVMPDAHRTLLQPTFADAITLARNAGNILPIRPNAHTLILYPLAYSGIPAVCGTHDPGAQFVSYGPAPTGADLKKFAQDAANSNKIVVFTNDAYHLLAQQSVVTAMPTAKTVVVALNNPYDFLKIPPVAGYVLSYTPALDAFTAVCNVLYGDQQPIGVLPVTLATDLPAGMPSLSIGAQ